MSTANVKQRLHSSDRGKGAQFENENNCETFFGSLEFFGQSAVILGQSKTCFTSFFSVDFAPFPNSIIIPLIGASGPTGGVVQY